MLDSNTAPLAGISPTRRSMRSGSDGYPRAQLQSQPPSYNLFDDFNYQEPSPERQLRYNRTADGSGRQLYSPATHSFNSNNTPNNGVEQFPYYQPNSTNARQALTRSPWHGSLWNPETQGNSILRSFFLLFSAMVGAGLACQAYAAQRSGWLLFLLFQLTVAFAADWTHVLMTELAEATGVTSYEDLVDGLYGTVGTCLMALVVLVQNIGSMIIYVTLFTQSAPPVAGWLLNHSATVNTPPLFNPDLLSTRALYVALVVAVFVLPLSFVKRIGKLGITGGIMTCAVVFVTCATVNYYYIHTGRMESEETSAAAACLHRSNHSFRVASLSAAIAPSPFTSISSVSSSMSSTFSNCTHPFTSAPPSVLFHPSTFISLPIVVYAYMSHATILPIHHEMSGVKRTGVKQYNTILSIRITMVMTIVVYTIVGIFGSMLYSNSSNKSPTNATIPTAPLSFNLMHNYQLDAMNSKSNATETTIMHVVLLCWCLVMGWSVSYRCPCPYCCCRCPHKIC